MALAAAAEVTAVSVWLLALATVLAPWCLGAALAAALRRRTTRGRALAASLAVAALCVGTSFGWLPQRWVSVYDHLCMTALIALGVVSLLKNVVGECRPRAWDDTAGQCVGTTRGAVVREDRVAFPSGHTAPLAAMAGAALGMMVLPSRARIGYWPVLVTAGALAITNFTLRVVAGAHSWVDTATGFALGAGLGFGTAALHTVTPSPRWTVGASPAGLTVAGTFD